MSLLAAWILFPVALAVVSGGLGLLVDRIAGGRLPGIAIVPVGFALALVVCDLGTSIAHRAALPVLVVATVAGLVVGRARVRVRAIDRWAVGLAVAVLVVFGAPAAFTGNPTFAGSLVLPDTSNQMALASQLAHAGRDYQSLPTSSFKTSAAKYLSSQYPVGAQATLGVLSPLGRQPLMWLYQPFLAWMMAMAALGLYTLTRRLVPARPPRALVALIAAQPALVYSYAQQGSIKEVGQVFALILVFALAAEFLTERVGARTLLPLAVASGASLSVLGPAALAYLAIPGLAVAGVWLARLRRPRLIREVTWAAVVIGVLALSAGPVLAGAKTAYTVNKTVLSMAADLGNLAAPLKVAQGVGVWLSGDFRYAQYYPLLGNILTIAVLVAAVLGVGWMIKRRAVDVGLMVGALVLVSVYLLRQGSPYADGKVLMVGSPAVVLAAGLGAVALGRHRLSLGIVAAVPLALAVLASNALAYHQIQDAPYHRYHELLDLNARYDGQGPTLFTEYDEYAGYLMRDVRIQAEPEAVLGYRGRPERRPSGLTDERHRPSVKSALDLDDLSTAYVQRMKLLVVRRSPSVSRPPADFRLLRRGRYYDVWRRQPGPRVIEHRSLGPNAFTPSAIPRCATVAGLAGRARRAGARLAYVERPVPIGSDPLGDLRGLPRRWFQYGAYPRAVVPSGPGRLTRTVRLPAGGSFRLWVEGSFGRPVHVAVDGRPVGSVSYEAGNPGQYFRLGALRLKAGSHRVTVKRGGGDLRPGSGGDASSSLVHIGPVVFSLSSNEQPRVRTVAPARATGLCGRPLDWIEIVRP